MENPHTPLVDRKALEATGAPYTESAMREAREKTWKAVFEIAQSIRPGMLESEGEALANKILKSRGAKLWHKTHVRFGENTLLHYGLPSKEGVRLSENDIFFVDIGPVWNGFEGDAGSTFVMGDYPEAKRCVEAGRNLFAKMKAAWSEDNLSGNALYQFAKREAEAEGWTFILDEANGHRLSDFPHAIHFRGGISELGFRPESCLWVLEAQIQHPDLPIGAFHEDLLLPDAVDWGAVELKTPSVST